MNIGSFRLERLQKKNNRMSYFIKEISLMFISVVVVMELSSILGFYWRGWLIDCLFVTFRSSRESLTHSDTSLLQSSNLCSVLKVIVQWNVTLLVQWCHGMVLHSWTWKNRIIECIYYIPCIYIPCTPLLLFYLKGNGTHTFIPIVA